ncbi:NRDE family protein [Microbacterium betulae]|uniref:NRDE family protein n=1 Tax=Microbacterium betulae TaxID=2981139 RepID=A0AA97FJP4_9MICO|nr:NRDE family protein [Microbacterium sp. AB]WOF23540.1 NRDE family protein [Microbacterium sp. AB]
MCTVIVRVPETPADPVRLLAVRDEDPARPWNRLGAWWPELPGVIGVQDRLAGGAWLAAVGGRLSVLLNREGLPDLPEAELASRGGIVLDSVTGVPPSSRPRTRGFNLLEVDGADAAVVSWDGSALRRHALLPGTHMIAHDDADDDGTPRIAAWRDAFAQAPTTGDDDVWWHPWLRVLEETSALPPTDDRAIVRDNRPHGVGTLSLLACVASVGPTAADVRYAELRQAGVWNPLTFR